MARAKPAVRKPRKRAAAGAKRLTIEVVWGDITLAEGDLFVVGHYQGVLPQAAEKALDVALSRSEDPKRMVLTDLTRRGVIRGALCDVDFFPWGKRKTVVLAGMGRPGTFHIEQLRRLVQNLVYSAGRLVESATVCSVLIGSGVGNLRIAEAASGLVGGLEGALADSPELRFGRIRIVERSLDRALEMLECLKAATGDSRALRVAPRLVEQPGGRVPDAFGYSMVLAAVAQGAGLGEDSPTRQAIEELMEKLPNPEFREKIKLGLGHASRRWRSFRRLALQFRLASDESAPGDTRIAMRMSFCVAGESVSSAAITNTVTVAERRLGSSMTTIQRALERLQAPQSSHAAGYGRGLARRLIHSDFKSHFDDTGPLVIEVDRPMARVQWEMLVGGDNAKPLGISRAVARQLRTSYSPRPADIMQRQTLRALVVGDPGDPARQQSLPDARIEAEAVAKALRKRGLDVTLLIGPPGVGSTRPAGAEPADLLDVVELLLGGEIDLVHYCGHALWDPSFPGRAGWLFKDGLLTSGDLEAMESPPMLVVANACYTAGLSALSGAANAATAVVQRRDDTELIAGLADEFFKRGVSDYIGTAWAVPSRPATLFATAFYDAVLPGPKSSKQAPKRLSLGEAVRLARQKLFDQRETYGEEHGAVWGAFQHYGDPTRMLELR